MYKQNGFRQQTSWTIIEMSIKKYLVIIEKAGMNFSAYSPDLPGCIATGRTVKEVTTNMKEVISLHVKGMIEDNTPVPPPQTIGEYLEVER